MVARELLAVLVAADLPLDVDRAVVLVSLPAATAVDMFLSWFLFR